MDIDQLKLELIQQILQVQNEALLQHFLLQLQQAEFTSSNTTNQDLLHVLLQKTSEPSLSQEDIEDVQRSISDIFEVK